MGVISKVHRSEDLDLIVEGSNRTPRGMFIVQHHNFYCTKLVPISVRNSRNQSQKLINISCLCDSAKVARVQIEYCTEKSHTSLHRERESESSVMIAKVPIHWDCRYDRT